MSFKVICFDVDENDWRTIYSHIKILVSYMKFRKIWRPQETKMYIFLLVVNSNWDHILQNFRDYGG